MKIFKFIYYLFFTCISVVVVFLVASIFPITGNYKILIVQSGSMEPKIKIGSIVVVKPADNYEIGQVITVKDMDNPKITVTHRLVEIKNENGREIYITKGDANNVPDRGGVEKDQIIGKVLFNVPYAGYAVAVAKKPYGFAALVIIPALIIIFDQVKKIIGEINLIRQRKKVQAEESIKNNLV